MWNGNFIKQKNDFLIFLAKAQVPRFMIESPFDTGMTRRVKRAYSSLDAVSIRTGVFLRRYPFARIFVLCYVVSILAAQILLLCIQIIY